MMLDILDCLMSALMIFYVFHCLDNNKLNDVVVLVVVAAVEEAMRVSWCEPREELGENRMRIGNEEDTWKLGLMRVPDEDY